MAFLTKTQRKGVTAQPRLEGIRRIPQGVLGLPDIAEAVREDCLKYHVSPGFVIMTIVAKHYGITEQQDYRTFARKTKRKRKGK